MRRIAIVAAAAVFLSSAAAHAEQAQPAAQAQPAQPPAGITPPSDYVIGASDVLVITFWEEPQMSGDVVVRPDGMITLPLLNDVPASGLRTDQLRDRLTEMAKKVDLLKDPRVYVGIRTINSRMVYIVGRVQKPGPYPLNGPLDVLSLLALAGGPLDYADTKKIRIHRDEGGKPVSLLFNYKEVEEGKNLRQNILLKPGDKVTVPE